MKANGRSEIQAALLMLRKKKWMTKTKKPHDILTAETIGNGLCS
jgi:hypothetical protein